MISRTKATFSGAVWRTATDYQRKVSLQWCTSQPIDSSICRQTNHSQTWGM